jgi:hypothetical protein
MPDTANPVRRPDVETFLLPDGSCLLFDSRTEEAHVLNVVGALVWDYCDGALSAEQIADELAPLLPEQPTLGDDVREMIEALAGKGLLRVAGASPALALPDAAPTT